MVRIKKDKLTFEVTYDVFKTHYKPNGWRIVDGGNKAKRSENPTEINEDIAPNVETDLMSMSIAELREYASANGIDISGANTKKEIRAIIESAVDI